MYAHLIIDKPPVQAFNVRTLNKEATMTNKARLAQIGYMLDHPASFGEVTVYMARLEADRRRLIDALKVRLRTHSSDDLDAVHEALLRELGEQS